ncbi:MAG: hypothetical protein AB7K24_31960 [Gemmataceae bacterium]
MLQANEHMVVGAFEDQRHARDAFRALRGAGFRDQQLQWVSDEEVTGVEPAAVHLQHTGYRGGMLGTVAGAGAGMVIGALIAAVITAAPLWTVVGAGFGMFAGAALGVFIGPFVAMEAEQRQVSGPPEPGYGRRTVIIVDTRDRLDEAASILRAHGAYDDSMRAR